MPIFSKNPRQRFTESERSQLNRQGFEAGRVSEPASYSGNSAFLARLKQYDLAGSATGSRSGYPAWNNHWLSRGYMAAGDNRNLPRSSINAPTDMPASRTDRQDMIATDQSLGEDFESRKRKGMFSRSRRIEKLETDYMSDDDRKMLELNDAFETALSDILEEDTQDIAFAMSHVIRAAFPMFDFQSYGETTQAITDTLSGRGYSSLLPLKQGARGDPEESVSADHDYSEAGLPAAMRQAFPATAAVPDFPADYQPGFVGDTQTAQSKLNYLGRFRKAVDTAEPTEENLAARQHFTKIYNTAKVNHMIHDQLGYSSGGIEFKAGAMHMDNPSYLLNILTRWHSNVYPFPMIKGSVGYDTRPGSVIPFNNQASISIGNNDFSLADIPEQDLPALNERIVNIWAKSPMHFVSKVLGGKLRLWPAGQMPSFAVRFLHRPPTIEELYDLIERSDDKGSRRKALYSLVLEKTWNRTPYSHDEENPFHGTQSDFILRNLDRSDIKDPELLRQAERRRVDPRALYGSTRMRGRTSGRNANRLVTPMTASLDVLEAVESQILPTTTHYNNSPWASQLGKIQDQGDMPALREKHWDIFKQSLKATSSWYANARMNMKPIYTGPSGHVLNFTNLYGLALDTLHRKEPDRDLSQYPTLEDARLFQLSDLMSPKSHHTYDETMTPTHDIGTQSYMIGDRRYQLQYRWPANYADIFYSPSAFGRKAAQRAKAEVMEMFQGKSGYRNILAQWMQTVDMPSRGGVNARAGQVATLPNIRPRSFSV